MIEFWRGPDKWMKRHGWTFKLAVGRFAIFVMRWDIETPYRSRRGIRCDRIEGETRFAVWWQGARKRLELEVFVEPFWLYHLFDA